MQKSGENEMIIGAAWLKLQIEMIHPGLQWAKLHMFITTKNYESSESWAVF